MRNDVPEPVPGGRGGGFWVVVAIGGSLALTAALSLAGWWPRCGFKVLTGFDCPGCGATRSLRALGRGEIGEAFVLNPGFVVALPVGLVALAIWLACRRHMGRVAERWVWLGWGAFLALTLAYWVVRNLDWWPWKLP